MTANLLPVTNDYRTIARPTSGLFRRQATPFFYAQVFMIVLKASRLAKKGRYSNAQWIKSSVNTLKALESVGGRFDIENVAAHAMLASPCVFIANHMSVLETFILPGLIQPQRDVTFVVKASLIDYPLFRHVMRSRNPIVVGRANPRQDLRTVLEEGQKRLNSQVSIVIFPQTTRSIEFEPGNFNTLGIKLAKRARVPVVPIALKTDAWGLGGKLKDFGKIRPAKTVHICFGEPLRVKGSGKEEHRIVVDFITSKLKDWQ
ncbi:MAG: lysophospholipid acyltransferase family protein [Deltaproteobacteria bacterium]|nr:lysophospholipid acyltransferase family protein [Deltaproteobacteria bacterium]